MDATVTEPEQQQSEIIDSSSLEALNRSEITTAVDIAKRYPRSIARFEQRALSIACGNPEVAASCWYRLKRRGKDGKETIIEGPSVRLAEIVAGAWGNIRFGARIVGDDGRFIIAQGVAHDLESNVSTTVEVRRRITTSTGKRYGDDMVGVTANAACSIALRNAINKTVPLAYTNRILAAAKKVAIGDAKSLDQRRQAMVTAFGQMGVSVEQLCAKVAKSALADIGLGEMEELLGVFTAIKDGDSTIDDEFAVAQAKPAELTARQKLNAALLALRAKNDHGAAAAVQQIEMNLPAKPSASQIDEALKMATAALAVLEAPATGGAA